MATTCFVLKVFWNLFISVSFYVFSMSLAYIMSTEFKFFMCSQNNENIILNHSVIKKEKNDVLYVLFSLHTICLYKVFW